LFKQYKAASERVCATEQRRQAAKQELALAERDSEEASAGLAESIADLFATDCGDVYDLLLKIDDEALMPRLFA
jgi:hypothetical protein